MLFTCFCELFLTGAGPSVCVAMFVLQILRVTHGPVDELVVRLDEIIRDLS
jgi:hypothetical protein